MKARILSYRFPFHTIIFFTFLTFVFSVAQPITAYAFELGDTKDFADTNFTLLGEVPSGYCNAVELIGDHYIAIGSGRGVRILDLNTSPNPRMVSQIYTGGAVEDLAAEGDYLYILLNGQDGYYINEFFPTGVVIVNVADPEHPVRKSFVDFSNLAIAQGIAVKNGFIYAGYVNGLAQIDATDPDNPQIIRHFALSSTPHNMVIQDNYLFVAAQNAGYLIYDISNNSISQITNIPQWAGYVAVNGSLLFALDQSNTVKIYSIENIANPEEISEFTVPNTNNVNYRFWSAASEGQYLYLTGDATSTSEYGGGVTIYKIDVSNPTQPQIVLGLSLLNSSGMQGTGLNIRFSNGIAYVAGEYAMEAFSVDNEIILSGYYPTFYIHDGIDINNNIAYYFYQVEGNKTRISAFDITNPKIVTELGSCTVSTNNLVTLYDYQVSDGYAYFGLRELAYPQEESGVKILDLGSINSEEPDISFIKIKNFNALEVYQNTLYITTNDTLYIYDVTSPQNPVYVNQFYVSPWDYGNLNALNAQGDYLYISTGMGMLVASILSPQSPDILGFYDSENGYNFRKSTIEANYAYLPGNGSFDVVDVSNPSEPSFIKSFTAFGDVKSVSVADGYVNVASSVGITANQWLGDTLITKGVYTGGGNGWVSRILTRGSWSYVAWEAEGLVILKNDNLSDVSEENILPSTIELYQNYPNPFNPTTTISYVVPSVEIRHALSLQLVVYDALGRKVATLVNKKQAPGKYSVQFNASGLPSGVYFYTLRAGDFVQTRKMILLK